MINRDILVNLLRDRPIYFPLLALQLCQEGRERGSLLRLKLPPAYALNRIGAETSIHYKSCVKPAPHVWFLILMFLAKSQKPICGFAVVVAFDPA